MPLRPIEARREGFVGRVRRVLLVDEVGDSMEGLEHLVVAHDAGMTPVGNVLAGDATGRANFHELHALAVRHLPGREHGWEGEGAGMGWVWGRGVGVGEEEGVGTGEV